MIESNTNALDDFIYLCIYCDDGFDMYNKKITEVQVNKWLKNFQVEVGKITESEFLKFTCEYWDHEDK